MSLQNKLLIGGLLLVGLSVWAGLRIGLNRDLLFASVLLFVIPLILIITIIYYYFRQLKKSDVSIKDEIRLLNKQLEEIKFFSIKIEKLIEKVNELKARIEAREKDKK